MIFYYSIFIVLGQPFFFSGREAFMQIVICRIALSDRQLQEDDTPHQIMDALGAKGFNVVEMVFPVREARVPASISPQDEWDTDTIIRDDK